MYAPMLIPLAALIAGILAANAGISPWVVLVVAILAAVTYLAIVYGSRTPVKSYRRNPLHHLWIAMLFFGAGILSYEVDKPYSLGNDYNKVICFAGEVKNVSSPVSGDKAMVRVDHFILNDGGTIRPRNCKLLVRSDVLGCSVGDIVNVKTHISPVEDNPNYFSSGYTTRLLNQGILYTCQIQSEYIDVIGHRKSFGSLAVETRDWLETFIEKRRISKATQNFIITILLGDRSYLDPEVRNLYADAGISHILALSGMHVAIISAILMWLLFPLNFFGFYRYRMLLCVLLLLFYAFLTGWSPSTVRATIMTTSLIICIFLERKNSAWNSLLLAAFLILLFNPMALWDVGMQLSFLCVASLIFFVNPLNPIEQRTHHTLYNAYRAVLTTMVATLATWCVTAWYFGRVPVMFLPSNLLVLPLLPAYLVLTIIYLVLAGIGCEWTWLVSAVEFPPKVMSDMLSWMQGGSSTSLLFTPSLASVVLWLAVILLAAVWINSKRTKLMAWSCAGVFVGFLCSVSFTLRAAREDFIIQRQASEIKILCRDRSGREQEQRITRGAVSEFKFANKKILVLDAFPSTSEMDNGTEKYDYILLSSGCKVNITDINDRYEYDRLIIHSNIRRDRENQILSEADSLGIEVHSLRRDGPLRNSAIQPQ